MRTRGLFWTFAGGFLVALLAAAGLQAVVSLVLLRPVQAQREREHVELALAHAADELAALPDPLDSPHVVRVLRANRAETGDVVLVFRGFDGGRMVPERELDDALERRIGALLAADRPSHEAPEPPGPGNPPPPRPGEDGRPPRPGAPPPRPGESVQPPRAPQLGEERPRREDGPHDVPGPEARPGAEPALLGQRLVAGPRGALGVVAAIRTDAHPAPWSLPEARAVVMSLPFAVLAAAIAGLLMVRLLVRRLRALERFAARVAAGDLEARVADSGDDEIGRLAGRFDRMTERLALARAAVEATDEQRRRLLADVSHELATPLTSIRGYVETLLDPAVPVSDEERALYLSDVLAEARRLELLIGDLFDLARLEAGTQPLSLQRLDWAALCANTVRRFEARFRDAGLTLAWSGPEDATWVRADGMRLEQVIDNLLVNALRYVPAGGNVRVSLGREVAAAGERVRLRVSDDGPGVAPADLPHLFDRFWRADGARGSEGSGLGLAIVREIVRRHGGDVHADAVTPHGIAFVIELPAGAESQERR